MQSVYCFDPITKIYTGMDFAFEDPFDKTLLIPAQSTQSAPPDITALGAFLWTGVTWVRYQKEESVDSQKKILLNQMQIACKNNITNGFPSSALGSKYIYGCSLPDQSNYTMLVTAQLSGRLWCGNREDTWNFIHHTELQIRTVHRDMITHIQTTQKIHQELVKKIHRTRSVKSLMKITWPLKEDSK